jgi:lipopolysaccharide/colanic/teichoic acid biosynthesis glycosyltransferase
MRELAKERVDAQSHTCECPKSDSAPPIATARHVRGTRVSLQSGLRLTFFQDAPILAPATPMRVLQLAVKRVVDVGVSAVALIMLGPALLLIALAIRMSSKGTILFRQTREGLDGKPIEIYKFRTMYIDRCHISGIALAMSDAARITPIGHFLRRTALDELPQLFNILKGDMSFIGPRPHVFGMFAGGTTYERLVPYYRARQTMKPGICGWAQANGLRGPTNNAIRARAGIDHDLAYIENFSLLLDIRIIWKTLRQEFLGGTGR